MGRKLLIVYVLSAILFGIFFRYLGGMMNHHQEAELRAESELLHQTVKETVQFNLEHIKDISLMAAGYFATEEMDERRYQKMGKSLVTVYPEVLGLNILNAEGVISRVYPLEENKEALGKTSQNLPSLLEAHRQQKNYWLSPPFELYQNGMGFVFYTSIVDADVFKGWVGIVLSYRKFFAGIQLERYLSKYHLIVKDATTGKNFFATTEDEIHSKYTFQSDPNFFGRKVTFYSFPRKQPYNFQPSTFICFMLSNIFAIIFTYGYRQKAKNNENKRKLSHLNALLSLTTTEASHVVNAVSDEVKSSNHIEVIKDNVAGYIMYLGNLLEQLTVTNSLSKPKLLSELTELELFSLVKEQLTFIKPSLERKKIVVHFLDHRDEHRFKGHKWLFTHSGIGNVLRYLTNVASEGSDLKITTLREHHSTLLSFHVNKNSDSMEKNPMIEMLERSLVVAQEVFIIHQIKMDIIQRPNELVIALHIPA